MKRSQDGWRPFPLAFAMTSPHGVENPSVPVDPEQFVGGGDGMEVGLAAVEEVSVWLPDPLQNVHTDWQRLQVRILLRKPQPGIHPALPEVAVHLVRLRKDGYRGVEGALKLQPGHRLWST